MEKVHGEANIQALVLRKGRDRVQSPVEMALGSPCSVRAASTIRCEMSMPVRFRRRPRGPAFLHAADAQPILQSPANRPKKTQPREESFLPPLGSLGEYLWIPIE